MQIESQSIFEDFNKIYVVLRPATFVVQLGRSKDERVIANQQPTMEQVEKVAFRLYGSSVILLAESRFQCCCLVKGGGWFLCLYSTDKLCLYYWLHLIDLRGLEGVIFLILYALSTRGV